MAATLQELSRAILAWLDQHPVAPDGNSAPTAWNTRQFRSYFAESLSQTLKAYDSATVISTLIAAFKVPAGTGSLTRVERQALATGSELPPRSLDGVLGQITNLLGRADVLPGQIEASPDTLARKIFEALTVAVRDESADPRLAKERQSSPRNGASNRGERPQRPRLHPYMDLPETGPHDPDLHPVPIAERRKMHVRMALAIFGMFVAALIAFSVVEPDSWLNPATGLFLILGYVTLVATSLAHSRSRMENP